MRPRFAPDARGEGDWTGEPPAYRVTIDGAEYTTAQARALGFARISEAAFSGTWVQANGFAVRGLIRRGDAQKFTTDELREVVRKFLADRGVEFEHPDVLEALTFHYHPGIDLDETQRIVRQESAA